MELPLDLTIRLKGESHQEAVIDTVVGAYSISKSTSKLMALIGGDIVQYAF
jgi:hypothetical protein